MTVFGDVNQHGIDLLFEHLAIIKECSRQPVGAFPDGIAARRGKHHCSSSDLVRAGFIGRIEQVRACVRRRRSLRCEAYRLAPSALVEASAVSPLAMMKLGGSILLVRGVGCRFFAPVRLRG